MFKINDVIDLVLVFLLSTVLLFTPFSSLSIVDFEQVNNNWVSDLSVLYELNKIPPAVTFTKGGPHLK